MKICIVAHNAYPAMRQIEGHVGGVEIQTTLFARWLAQRGHQVSLITWAHESNSDPVEEVDGVQVVKLCHATDGLPGLRFLHPRLTSLWQALTRVNPDVCYHNGAEQNTGIIALWCKRQRNKVGFVFYSASDADCRTSMDHLHNARERWLYQKGMQLADRFLVQTKAQQGDLLRDFGRHSEVAHMPCEALIPTTEERAYPAPFRVLYIGRIAPEKRIEWVLDVAAAIPDIEFEIAGKFGTDDYALEISKRANSLDNVSLLGFVHRKDLLSVYNRASLLICTSTFEGFPNTFLEALSCGIPIVTTVDPDRVIETNQMGAYGATPEAIEQAISQLRDAPEIFSQAATAARTYFASYHAAPVALAALEAAVVEVGANKAAGQS